MCLRLLASLPLIALAACTVGPDYERPKTALATDWLEPASTAPADATWWKAFGDPTLTGLVERALASSPDLRQARARVAEARALREAAQGGRNPQVSMTRNTTLNRISENGQFPVANIPGFDPEFPLLDVGFDASWEIDMWGRTTREIERALAQEDAAGWAERDAIVSLTAEIARNYVDFRLAQEVLAIAQSELEASEALASLSELRAKAGEGTRIEAGQAAAEHKIRAATRSQSEAAVAAAAYSLAALVGIAPEQIVPELLASKSAIPSPPDAIASGIRSDLLERRPDIRKAERDLAAATAGIGVATADLYPRVSLVGSIGLQSQTVDELVTGESLRYSIGQIFRWPFLSFGRVRAQIRAADARADGAGAAYEGTVMKALSESEGAANRFAAASAGLQSVDTALAQEKEAFRLATLLFERGETSRLALEQARLRLAQADRRASDARAARAGAAVALYKALGGGWEQSRSD